MEWTESEELLEEGEIRPAPEKKRFSHSFSQISLDGGGKGGDGYHRSAVDNRDSNAFYVKLGVENSSKISSDFFWNNEAENALRN